LSYAYARVVRGGITESLHRMRVRVVDADDRPLLEAGAQDAVTYLRSSWKPIQALGLITWGTADECGLTDEEIAVCCASHSSASRHLQAVRSALAKAGITEAELACGAHMPIDDEMKARLRDQGREPTNIHNNCSGKHTGMLIRSVQQGYPTEGYLNPEHPVQVRMIEDAARICEVETADFVIGTDGCTAPTWGLPLSAAARGWARLGAHWEEFAEAGERITRAMGQNPILVGGEGRPDTRVMQATGGRVVCKSGAEACVGLCVPTEGLGLALKCEDGNARGVWCVVIEILRRLKLLTDSELEELADLHRKPLRNCNQLVVGHIEPVISEEPPESEWIVG
jgi:L-asparaginase II